MGSDLKKTIVLDFFGVPGSGKTTKSHEIAESYRRKKKTVVEPSYDLDHGKSSTMRKIIKLWMLIQLPGKKRTSIKELVRKNGYNSSNGELNQIVNIASKIYAIKKYDGRVDYIIFDEGLAQAAISLSVNSEIPADNNLKQIINIIKTIPEVHLIDTRLSIVEALRRIEKRNSGDTRIEAMKTVQEKEKMMERYEEAVNQIDDMQPIDGISAAKLGGGY
jgi:thymidylate kinase